jgi:hypothetical protein
MIEVVREVPVIQEVERIVEKQVKYYVKENGDIYDENGNLIGNENPVDTEKKVLRYQK